MTVEFVCDNVTLREACYVASSQLMEFVVMKCWLVVQQGCKHGSPLPYSIVVRLSDSN